jgi:hypothetical protein
MKETAEGRILAKLNGFQWLNVMVGGGLKLNEVPEHHWRRESTDGTDAARVRCACGRLPLIEATAHPASCDCGRWFFYDATGVYSMCRPNASGDSVLAA